MTQPASTSRPLVVGYDGSDGAEKAVRWAAAAAAHAGAPLVVLHAADRIQYAHDAGVGIWDPTKALESSRKAAEAGARIAREQASGLEATARGSLLGPRQALDEASAGAAGVVVGTRGLGRVRSTLLGATAYGVTGHARCPVTVVPSSARLPGPDAPVVVGVDGSVSAERAAESGAQQAAAWGARLHLMTCWKKADKDPWGIDPAGFDSEEDAAKAFEEAALKIADEAKARVVEQHPDLEVTTSAPSGRADEALLDASSEAGLLVVGTRGGGGWLSSEHGSTSRNLLHLSKVAVQIVP